MVEPKAASASINSASSIQGSTLHAAVETKTQASDMLEKELQSLKSRLSSLEMEMENGEKGLGLFENEGGEHEASV